jgi:hypothetical protein
MEWPLDLKKSKKDRRISAEVISAHITVCAQNFKVLLPEARVFRRISVFVAQTSSLPCRRLPVG